MEIKTLILIELRLLDPYINKVRRYLEKGSDTFNKWRHHFSLLSLQQLRNTHVHLRHTCINQLQLVAWKVVEATLVYFWFLEASPSFFFATF